MTTSPPEPSPAQADRPPVPAWEPDRAKRLFVRVIAWATIFSLPTLHWADMLAAIWTPERFLLAIIGSAVALISLGILNRGGLRASAALLTIAFFPWLAWGSVAGGGVAVPGVSAYMILVLLAGWIFGWRAMLAVLLLSIAWLTVLAGLESLHMLPDPLPFPPFRRALTYVIVFSLMGLMGYLIVRESEARIEALAAARMALEQQLMALKASESQLRIVAENVPAMLTKFDRDMRCVWSNQAYARTFGGANGIVVGRHLSEILGEADFRVARPQVKKALVGEAASYTLRSAGPGGERRELEVSLVPDRAPDGAVLGWLDMVRDITEQTRKSRLLGALAYSAEPETGQVFFRSLVSRLAAAFDVPCALVAELVDGQTRARSLAFCDGEEFLPELTYAVEGTPCARTVANGHAYFASGAAQLFPEDVHLAQNGIESYFGMTLRSISGESIGVLLVMDRRPMLISDEMRAAMRAFAAAAAAELERLRADSVLRESQRLFETTFLASPVPMTIYTTEEMRYIACNDAFLASTGLERAEVIGRTGWELGLWPDREARQRLHDILRREGSLRDAELQIVSKTGVQQTHLICAELIDINGVPCVMSQGFDITERKRAEETVRASEARFEAAFHDSPAPLMIVSAEDGRYHDVNRAWLELTGRKRDQVIGHTSAEFGLWVDPAARQAIVAAVLRDGSVDRYETRLRRGDGEERLCQISSRSFEHKGLRLRLASIWDITDQRRAQKQMEQMNAILERMVAQRTRELSGANAELHKALQTLRSAQDQLLQSEKMAALGRLVAGVAHELNTPIGNGLLVATSLSEKTERFVSETSGGLRRSTLDSFLADSREAADMLTRSLHKAADLVASFKQVAADQTSSQRRSFQLDEVVDEVLLTHRPMLRKTPVDIESQVPPGIVMDSYPGPLGQVLANLINNSIVHGHEGRAQGKVVIGGRRIDDATVELTVRDDGHGIPEDDLRRVFDPFFTTKLGRGGTGLGLPICHTLVTQTLGGDIHIESAPGAGTAVILRLPLRAPVSPTVDAAGLQRHAA